MDKITQAAVGKRLRELREANGLSGNEVATKLGKSGNSYISRIESGETSINIDNLKQICDLYNVTLGEIFSVFNPSTKSKGFLDRVMFRSDTEANNEIKNQIENFLPQLRKLGDLLGKIDKKPLLMKDIDPHFSENIYKDVSIASKYAASFALKLRDHLGIGKNALVDIQDICWKLLNIPTCGVEMGDDIWGIYSRDREETPLIIYTLNPKNKQRNIFTIAHELGHHFFFKDGLSIDYTDLSDKTNIYEKVANKFAQELLVPSDFLRLKFDEMGLSLVNEIKPKHVAELCNFFKVSYAMMIYCLLSCNKIDENQYKTLKEYGEEKLDKESKGIGYSPETYFSIGSSLSEKLEEVTLAAYRLKKITRFDAVDILDITSAELLKRA